MNSRQRIALLNILTLMFLLVACGNADDLSGTPESGQGAEPTTASPNLDGTEWVLAELNGGDLVAGSNITLSFAEGRASGFAGCNAYGGGYSTADDGSLAIAEMAITAQACLEPEGIMAQEADYVQALRDAAAYRLVDGRLEIADGQGQALLLFDGKEELAMDPADLVGTRWQLVSMNGVEPLEGSTITLRFDDEGRGSGHAGCRDYNVTYRASGDDIGFPQISMLGDDYCPERQDLLVQEGDYTTMLEWATNYRLGEGQLKILTARGETLIFESWPEEIGQPGFSCDEYLDLSIVLDGVQEQAVVTSYHCQGASIDSTGQSPTKSPSLIVRRGIPLHFRLGAEAQPQSLDARLYPGAGVAASFFRWPEDLPLDIEPTEQFQPAPSFSFDILPQAPSGEYSLVIRATWPGTEVFYAFSFRLE